MKIKLNFLVLLLILSPLFANAQEAAQQNETDVTLPAQSKKLNRFNVRVSPILPIAGFYSGTIEIGVGDSWTIGPHYSYFRWKVDTEGDGFFDEMIEDIFSFRVQVFGLNFKKYWRGQRFKSSWYNEMTLGYLQTKNGRHHVTRSGSLYNSLSGGYHWFWDSGFNMNLGLGIQGVLKDTKYAMAPLLDFNLGFSF